MVYVTPSFNATVSTQPVNQLSTLGVPLKSGTPVIVTWEDPSIDTDAGGEAKDIDEFDKETATTSSIGWWVKEAKGMIVIASDLYPLSKKKTPEFRCIQRIQRALVKKVTRLTA